MRALFLTDRPLAESLQPALAALGVVIDVAEQAARADFKVQTECYDVVLLDRDRLGDLGYARLGRWRRIGLQAHVLVLLPGTCDVYERAALLNAGADAYLLRPFCVEELRARFRALGRQCAPAQDPILRTHDLEIDTVARSARRAGRVIRLTPREFELLWLLAAHQGRVLSRSMILEHLYDGESEEHSNVVDVFIRYLRNKIDRGFDTPLILTRRGQGYLLRA
jgi:two-component system, OmpR family, response regulator